MFNAKTVDGLVTDAEAQKIVEFARSIETWESGGDGFWDNRSLNAINVYTNYSQEIGMLLYDIRERVGKEIRSLYGIDEVYPDLFQIVRWFPGMSQPPHADDMTDANTPEEREMLEWFRHRHYGAIIYMNDDYDGGHTYYPQHNFEITPKIGTLAVHPGDPDHMHGVTEVQNGMRYTLASFWSRDKEYFDGWVM